MALRICQAVDPAIGQTHRADFFVIATVGMEMSRPTRPIFILDIFRDRIPFPDQPRAIEAAWRKWRPYGGTYVAVETLFYQSALIQQLIFEGRVPCRPIDRRLGNRMSPDKETRAAGLQARYENGQIHHPPWAPWLEAYETELLAAFRGTHDDQIDAVVDAVDALTLGARWTETAANYLPFEFDPEAPTDESGLYASFGIRERV